MVTDQPPLDKPATPHTAARFAELFAHRRWVRRTHPFPHVYARDVFVPEFHRQLTEHYAQVRRDKPEAVVRVAANYSADGVRLSEFEGGPMGVFLTREWHDLVAGVGGIDGTGDVEGSVHHHEPGAPYGWPHNDLNPAWFQGEEPGEGEVRFPDGTVDTKFGTHAEGVVARETIRGVAVLYYFGNPGWQQGDGGETALYNHLGTGSSASTVSLIPPLDNSLIMFQVTPRTWHTFAGNNTKDRNSVVMWVHRRKQDVLQRWGGDRIVPW